MPESLTPAYGALTPKQQKFVDHFIETGNATDAARQSGYANPNTQGPRLLVNVSIQTAIKERQTDTPEKRIASARDVLSFLTSVMENDDEQTNNRVRAAELLGKRHLLWKERDGEDLPDLNEPPYDPLKKS